MYRTAYNAKPSDLSTKQSITDRLHATRYTLHLNATRYTQKVTLKTKEHSICNMYRTAYNSKQVTRYTLHVTLVAFTTISDEIIFNCKLIPYLHSKKVLEKRV